jgi:hypothetical protein
MIELSATKCNCIAILWVSLVSFDAVTLCIASQRVSYCELIFRYQLSPETFGYTSYIYIYIKQLFYSSFIMFVKCDGLL